MAGFPEIRPRRLRRTEALRRLVSEGRADIVRSLRARATDLAAAR